jgi:hypothetical protein
MGSKMCQRDITGSCGKSNQFVPSVSKSKAKLKNIFATTNTLLGTIICSECWKWSPRTSKQAYAKVLNDG